MSDRVEVDEASPTSTQVPVSPSCHSQPPSLAGPADLLPVRSGRAVTESDYSQPCLRYQPAVSASPSSVGTFGAQMSPDGTPEELTTQSG